jgi:hypothetical protein
MEYLTMVAGFVGLTTAVTAVVGRVIVRRRMQERNLMRMHLSRITQTVD